MMEQWTNARDRNILDAWTNKGKFEGKKVTDKDILAHYRKRRNSYDKDDPEWDEWNNELFQTRFRISNETVMMNYRLGKTGPAAVASHYRRWAKTMPKNSSYYRNMMQSAGDFAKAAESGRAAAAKQFDYTALQRRVNALNRPVQQQAKFFEVLNNYARSHSFIEQGESVFTATTFEAADLAGLMAGLDRSGDPEWEAFKKAQKKEWPDWTGDLSWRELHKMTDKAIAAKRKQIAEYKKAPADYSSAIRGLRNDIHGLKDVKRIKKWANTMEDYETVHREWLNGREESDDPDTFLDGDQDYIKDLRRIRQAFLDIAEFGLAGDVLLEIHAINGNTEATNGSNNTPLWRDSNDTTGGSVVPEDNEFDILANSQATMIEAKRLLAEGKVYLVRIAPGTSDTDQQLGVDRRRTWAIRSFEFNQKTGKPYVPDESYMAIARYDSEGRVFAEMLVGTPIFSEDGKTIIAYRAGVDGVVLHKIRHPSDSLGWFVTDEDPFTIEYGARLVPDGNGLRLEADPAWEANYTDLRTELVGGDPSAILDELLGGIGLEPTAGSTPEYTEQWNEANDLRNEQIAAIENIDDLGLDRGDLPPDAVNAWGEDPNVSARAANTMIDEMRVQYPIGGAAYGLSGGMSQVDSEEAQTALIRHIIRLQWKESNGPLPENLRYNEADSEIFLPDGKWTERETASEAAMRIAMNDGVDIYNGEGKPYERGVVPEREVAPDTGYVNPGTGFDDGATEPVGEPPATGSTADQQTAFSQAGDVPDLLRTWGENGTWAEFLTNHLSILSQDLARSAPTAALMLRMTNTEEDISPDQMQDLIYISGLDPSANDFVLQQVAVTLDAVGTLNGERGLARTLMAQSANGDFDPVAAGAAYGELRAAQDKRVPAFDAYMNRLNEENPLPDPNPFGTPGYDFDAQTFIHQSPDEVKTNQFVGGPDIFSRFATNGGLDPTPPPAATVNPQVPQVEANIAQTPKTPTFNLPDLPSAVQTTPLPPGVSGPPAPKTVKVPGAAPGTPGGPLGPPAPAPAPTFGGWWGRTNG